MLWACFLLVAHYVKNALKKMLVIWKIYTEMRLMMLYDLQIPWQVIKNQISIQFGLLVIITLSNSTLSYDSKRRLTFW